MKKKRSMLIAIAIVFGMVCFAPIKQTECSKKVFIVSKKSSKATRTLSAGELETIKKGLYNSINSYRKSKKRKTLTKQTALEKSANVRTKEIVNKFSHTRPNGTRCFTAFATYKKKGVSNGENLSKVSFNAKSSYSKDYLNKAVESMMKTLKSSKTHKDVMLNKAYTKYGIAVTVKKSGNTITVYSAQHYSSK